MNMPWSSSQQPAEKNISTLTEIKGIGGFDYLHFHLAASKTENLTLQQKPHGMEQRRQLGLRHSITPQQHHRDRSFDRAHPHALGFA